MTEHLKEIIERWRNGESAGLIAKAIPELTRNQVIGLIWRRKIKRKPRARHTTISLGRSPVLDKLQVKTIRQSDESLRVLAERLGVGRNAVWRARNGLGAYAR